VWEQWLKCGEPGCKGSLWLDDEELLCCPCPGWLNLWDHSEEEEEQIGRDQQSNLNWELVEVSRGSCHGNSLTAQIMFESVSDPSTVK
jgi:hypothetical protein